MKKRIIARLDIKGPNVIKGVQFECLRVMGKPADLAQKYYEQGADEIIYLDTVASLYRRNNILNIVKEASQNIFIPFIAGGGVRTLEDIRSLLAAGAEKVAINTAATKNPELIRQAAKRFGSQCIVLSIEAKLISPGKWEAYTDNGRQRTGLDVVNWAKHGEKLGAGEILLTSVDMDGTERGLDLELIRAVTESVSIPVIASGGIGSVEDISECLKGTKTDAVATASILHYNKSDIPAIKKELIKNRIEVRPVTDLKDRKNQNTKYDSKNYNKHTLKHLRGVIGSSVDRIDQKQNIRTLEKDYPKGTADIGIIDYKINNVMSVVRAFQKIGQKISIIEKPSELRQVKALVLPGVGSFGDGMKALNGSKFVEPLRQLAKQGVPVLGICLGMQMLFSESQEFGKHKGLGLVPGKVIPFKPVGQVRLNDYKLPHIGWNKTTATSRKTSALMSGINDSDVYFVHSFYPKPENKDIVIGTTEYGDQKFCAVFQKDNIMGAQFHPEKSGEVGLTLLRNFCKIISVKNN